MSDKPKYPRAEAVAVAKALCDVLKPHCERLIVAGSLRRRRAEVGDVEILYIPKLRSVEVPSADLFAPPRTALVDEVDAQLDWLLENGVIRQRKNVNGSVTWGEKNKLAVHSSGIPVDYFAATEASWFNYLVCRTGGAELNTRIAALAKRKGWQWNPYQSGFTKVISIEEHFNVKSERDVFEFVGLRYLEPWERR